MLRHSTVPAVARYKLTSEKGNEVKLRGEGYQEICRLDVEHLSKITEGDGGVGLETEVAEGMRRRHRGTLAGKGILKQKRRGDSRWEGDGLDLLEILKEEIAIGHRGEAADRVGDAQLDGAHQRIRGHLLVCYLNTSGPCLLGNGTDLSLLIYSPVAELLLLAGRHVPVGLIPGRRFKGDYSRRHRVFRPAKILQL